MLADPRWVGGWVYAGPTFSKPEVCTLGNFYEGITTEGALIIAAQSSGRPLQSALNSKENAIRCHAVRHAKKLPATLCLVSRSSRWSHSMCTLSLATCFTILAEECITVVGFRCRSYNLFLVTYSPLCGNGWLECCFRWDMSCIDRFRFSNWSLCAG